MVEEECTLLVGAIMAEDGKEKAAHSDAAEKITRAMYNGARILMVSWPPLCVIYPLWDMLFRWAQLLWMRNKTQ